MDSVSAMTAIPGNISAIRPYGETKGQAQQEGPQPRVDEISISSEKVTPSLSFPAEDYTAYLASKRKGEKLPEDRRTRAGILAASTAGGAAAVAGTHLSGVNVWLHENGHMEMAKQLQVIKESCIQIDRIDLLKQLINSPSMENLKDYVFFADYRKDNMGGFMWTVPEGTTKLGDRFTPQQRDTLIIAAGPAMTFLPVLAGYAVGHKLRRSHPALGYSLMLGSVMNYPLVAYGPLTTLWAKPGTPGDYMGLVRNTGLPPAAIAAIGVASLPVLAVTLTVLDDIREKEQEKRLALASLVEKGGLSAENLNDAMKDYPYAEKLLKAEDSVAELTESLGHDPENRGIFDSLMRETKKLQREYDGFSRHLMKKYAGPVEEERRKIHELHPKGLRETVKALASDLKKDPVRSSLDLAAAGGSLAYTMKNVLDIPLLTAAFKGAPAVTGTIASAGAALGAALPVVSLAGLASSSIQTFRALKSDKVSNTGKALSLAGTACCAMSAGGLLIPALGAPVALAGVAGSLGILGIRLFFGDKLQ